MSNPCQITADLLFLAIRWEQRTNGYLSSTWDGLSCSNSTSIFGKHCAVIGGKCRHRTVQIFSLHKQRHTVCLYSSLLGYMPTNKKPTSQRNVYLSSSLLGQMVEKIERWWAFLDNNLSNRHQCSRSALWGSLWSHGAVLLQLRLVSHSSLNSLTAKLHWTRFWWAPSARSVHQSTCFISTVADTPEVTGNQTHLLQNVAFVTENFELRND